MRIGVFVCWCGSNIAANVDVRHVSAEVAKLPGVAFATNFRDMCSDPGQTLVREAIATHKLDRVIVSACSPKVHELTFRRCIEDAGINPYMLEIANIREQCSWVHAQQKDLATVKAIELIKIAVGKISGNQPLFSSKMKLERQALVIGAGIAGIQSSLDMANMGYQVTLVEREPSIGGRMAQFDKVFPTLDCAACIFTPKMVDIDRHPNIDVLTYSELEHVSGFVGNFNVRIRRRARKVDMVSCTGCGSCTEKCPKKVISKFDELMGTRKAIYKPFSQAIPNVPIIDTENCTFFLKGKCKLCEKVCPANSIRYDQEDEIIEKKFGAIVVATGFETIDPNIYPEYGYDRHQDVITSMQLERMLNASGPTGGHVLRPSNKEEPKDVVFIQCVGSRDDKRGKPYCSQLCCTYTAKQAMLIKEHLPNARVHVFYIDIRAVGKNYEAFVRRAQEKYGAQYLRGRVSRIFQDEGQLVVRGNDTLSGLQLDIRADLVVLATAIVPRFDVRNLAHTIGISTDEFGFFTELHPKLGPVENATSGVYLAGVCQGPKDITNTVNSASATASKVAVLFAKEYLLSEPMIAFVDSSSCVGCTLCVTVCPYKAIDYVELKERSGAVRMVAQVNPSLCRGCGTCAASCRSTSVTLRGFDEKQIYAAIDAFEEEPAL